MEEKFSVRAVPRLYNEYQPSLGDSLETAVRRVGGWCEVAAMVGSVVRSEKLVAEAGNNSGTQMKGNVGRGKPLPSNG
jgi:hypothetical protein